MSAPESANPFHSTGFSRWWLASMAAGTGAGIQTVTVPLFIRDRVEFDDRALAIAAALIAQSLPGAFLALVGGAVADRVERRLVLARTYAFATLVSIGYVVLSGLDVRQIWPVFPLAMIIGSASAFASPARQSLLPELVTRPQIQNGVILGTMGFIATLQFLGPSVAGFMVDGPGMTAAFALETVLLAAGMWLFWGVRAGLPEPTGRSMLGDLADGVRYVRAEPALVGLLGLGLSIGVCFIGPFAVTVPVLVPDVLHASDKWVGLLWAAFGSGVFAGSLLLTWKRLPRRGLAVCLSIALNGGLQTLYGMSETLALSAVLQICAGLTASIFMNYVVALLQENTEPRMMGRVMSMYSLVFFASVPIGYAQAGFVTSAFGPQTTLVSSGLAAVAIGSACVITLKRVRQLV